MPMLDQLSSRVGDKTEGSNRAVAEQCLSDASLLPQIADGLRSGDRMLAGDCAEVLTMVAEANPALVSPLAGALCAMLELQYTRARWEGVHALALVAKSIPESIHSNLPVLAGMIRTDRSTIACDYAVDAVANCASIGSHQAQDSYCILLEAAALWEGKHAHDALPGLAHVASCHPEHREEIRRVAEDKLDHPKGVVQKAARDLLRSLKWCTQGRSSLRALHPRTVNGAVQPGGTCSNLPADRRLGPEPVPGHKLHGPGNAAPPAQRTRLVHVKARGSAWAKDERPWQQQALWCGSAF
jgi:hypothetical protein